MRSVSCMLGKISESNEGKVNGIEGGMQQDGRENGAGAFINPNQCDRQAHERQYERPLTMHGSEQNGTEEYGSSSGGDLLSCVVNDAAKINSSAMGASTTTLMPCNASSAGWEAWETIWTACCADSVMPTLSNRNLETKWRANTAGNTKKLTSNGTAMEFAGSPRPPKASRHRIR